MKTFDWLGREFVAVSCEGAAGVPADQGMDGILDRIEEGIGETGPVPGRHGADAPVGAGPGEPQPGQPGPFTAHERAARARPAPATSPPDTSTPSATVALDFIAMRSGGGKKLVEYDPPIVPLRYLDLEGLVFLSGVTSTSGDLAEQVSEVCGLIGESLEHAGAGSMPGVSEDGSRRVARLVSFFLQGKLRRRRNRRYAG